VDDVAEKIAESAGADVPTAHSAVRLGSRLRAVRQTAGLSLREVARQLGVSPSFVSQLENGKSHPSVATLYSLSQLLDVPIDQLFTPDHVQPGLRAAPDPPGAGDLPAGPPSAAGSGSPISRVELGSPADAWDRRPGGLERLSVSRPGTRPRIIMNSGVIWEQLVGNTGSDLDFIEVVYPPGSSSTNDSRMLRHSGYEYGWLLEGELEVTFGFEVFTLCAGEAMGLDSSVPHLLNNRGTVRARGIWCVLHRRP
jgi:transcriptional regulator with XRE-family HTH domain/mannose-6-phosphate isomerase-like protein (cupin superfamily)